MLETSVQPAARRTAEKGAPGALDTLLWLSIAVVPCVVAPGLWDPLLLPKTAAFKAIFCAAALLAALGGQLRRPASPPAGVAWALGLLGSGLVVSTWNALLPAAALTQAETLACWALWTALLVPIMSRERFAQNAAQAAVAAGLLQVFVGFLQKGAFRGTFSGAQECSIFLGAALVLTVYGRWGLSSARRACCAALLAIGTAACGSWTLWLALGGAGAAMALRGDRGWARRAAAAGALAACVVGLGALGSSGWGPALRALALSRGAGLGLGALDHLLFPGRAPSALFELLCEGGPVLLAAWFLLIGLLLRRAFQRRHGRGPRAWTAVVLFLALASLASSAPRGLPAMLLLGLAAAGLLCRRAPRLDPPAVSWRRPALLGLTLLCVLVVSRQVRLLGSSRRFAQAQAALVHGRAAQAAALTDQALALDPGSAELSSFRARLAKVKGF